MRKSTALLFIIGMNVISYFVIPDKSLSIQISIYATGYFIVKLLEEKL